MKRILFAVALCAWFTSCTEQKTEEHKEQEHAQVTQELNLYTHRHYDIDRKLFKQFEDSTGIKINVISAKADQLIQRIEQEGEGSPADVLITVDAARLVKAKNMELLQPISSEVLSARIPAHYRDPENHWFGLTMRSRVIVCSKDRVAEGDVLNYEDLADPKWKGKVLVRSSGNVYNQSLMASILANSDAEGAKSWAEGVVSNFARDPKGNDRDQVKEVLAGTGDLAVVNTYYIGKLLNSDQELEKQAGEAVRILFPNQGNRGAHVNISGAAICKHAPNKAAAVQFLEYLSAVEQQEAYAQENHEYPVNPEAEASDLLKSWGDFKADTINLSVLGELNKEAVQLFDQAGWK